MKLTLVTETFPPEVNGVAMTLDRLTSGIRKRGVEVEIVCPGRGERDPQNFLPRKLFQLRGLPIPGYPELRFGMPARRQLRQRWRTDRPDMVHIATEGPLGWSALRAARRLHIPVVSSFHTNFHSYGQHYGFGFLKPIVVRWLRNFHNRTSRTFVPSGDLQEHLRDLGFRNLRLMARGVDTGLFNPQKRNQVLRKSWAGRQDAPVALYVGRLAAEKNLDLAIRAWQRMRNILPNLQLVLVGDGPERERIQARFPEIHLAGMQRGEALAAHYASVDCFLFASLTETFGNVVTEAMATGLPVLAFDYAAAGQFIEQGHNGCKATHGNEEEFLRQASVLARQQPLWAEMGMRARERVLPLSWDSIAGDYLAEVDALALRHDLQPACP